MTITKRGLINIGEGLLAILAFVILVLAVQPSYLILPAFLNFILALMLILPFFRKNFEIFEPFTFFALMYSGFILSAAYSLSNDALISGIGVSGSIAVPKLNKTLLFLIIGLGAFYLGYFPRMHKIDIIEKPSEVSDDYAERLYPQVMQIILLYAIVGFIGYYLLYVRPMGGFRHLLSLYGRTRTAGEDIGASSMFAPMLWWASLLWYRYYLDGHRNPLFIPFLGFSLFAQFVKGRILSGVVTPILMLLIIWRYSPRGRNKKFSAVSLFLCLAAIASLGFGVYGYRRAAKLDETQAATEYIQEVLSPRGFVELILDSNNLPGITITTQIFDRVPQDLSYQYGRTFLYLFGQMIPKRFLPQRENKPTVGAMVRDTWYEPWRGNQPPTLIGELYLNFGWMGIIVGMYLFGRFCAYLYERLVLRHSDWFIIVYAAFVTKFVMLVVKGEFGDHMNATLSGIVIPIWVSLLLAKLLYDFEKDMSTKNSRVLPDSGDVL